MRQGGEGLMPGRAKSSSPKNAENRSDERRKIRLEVQSASSTGDSFFATLRNVSRTGLLLEADTTLAIGNELLVDLPEAGRIAATVVWSGDRMYGCRFASPISRAALGAARLKSVPEDQPSRLDHSIANSDEPLHKRLRRLREQSGLSVAELADLIKVSKPSVWNWENDKTRPKSENLDSLARALGTTAREILFGEARVSAEAANSGQDASSIERVESRAHQVNELRETASEVPSRLAQLIAASKVQIAALAGTEPAKVTIIIEF
jgi:transcriptional regulator with XRE-family HTH domain